MAAIDDWRDDFVIERDQRAGGMWGELLRKVRAGTLVRVARGVYHPPVPPDVRPAKARDLRYLYRVQGAQLAANDPLIFAFHSAAAIWGLPAIGEWPPKVHVICERAQGGRSTAGLQRHTIGPVTAVDLHGLRVTSIARTVVDIARSNGLREAVTMADAALHGLRSHDGRVIRAPIAKSELLAELEHAGSGAGVVKARVAIEMADGAAESPGESVSRVGFHDLGLPKPRLQVSFSDRFGKIGTVDFWWPEFALIGEFDGEIKYQDPVFLAGRTPQEALHDEKRREDRLRALGHNVTRWGWSTATTLPRLRDHMRDAGLR
ncbi:hypothetical protein GCM10027413_08570 [Conyzicola nivalis]|uniref:CTP synthase n=1 Tax=Conyzicola nivalis TaxID=1477021 RepID=A0A916WIP4_9MICO|nr:hypothetical protein [Conyzicola nivalis]GGB03767.1 CTP synthase [Conyzicola nivalis]